MLFFFNDPATTEINTLSQHDALPIYIQHQITGLGQKIDKKGWKPLRETGGMAVNIKQFATSQVLTAIPPVSLRGFQRSEEHTSELQSLTNLVCRLLLEKKKIIK